MWIYAQRGANNLFPEALLAACNRLQTALTLGMPNFGRRQFLRTSLSAARASPIAAWAARSPIKLAHREGDMLRQSLKRLAPVAADAGIVLGLELSSTKAAMNHSSE